MRASGIIIIVGIHSSTMRSASLPLLVLGVSLNSILLLLMPVVVKRLSLDMRLSVGTCWIECNSICTHDATLVYR